MRYVLYYVLIYHLHPVPVNVFERETERLALDEFNDTIFHLLLYHLKTIFEYSA
jgi:hypothetical protein